MTEKVRELIDDVVWSTDDSVNMGAQLDKIINDHVVPMVFPAHALKTLQEWADAQSKIHADKASKLLKVNLAMTKRKEQVASVWVLINHHNRISTRYFIAATRLLMRRPT